METKDLRKEFGGWLKKSGITLDLDTAEKLLINSTKTTGIRCDNLYKESDPIKIQLLASELIIKRDAVQLERASEYNLLISMLIYYIEFLRGSTESPKKELEEKDKTKDALTIAYYLSRVNKKALERLKYKSFREAFEKLGRIIGQKPATIKNMRDEFDPYFDNGRVGWYQRPLRSSRREVFDSNKNIDDEQLYRKVVKILESYAKESADNGKNQHKKITITNTGMKEVKTRRQK